jgi:hydrogenase nickel incorporation protein HypB
MEGDLVDNHSQSNRIKFRDLGIAVVTILSAPRAGKTSLLEKTLPVLKSDFKIAVIAADVYASFDAERIRVTGVPVWQLPAGKEKAVNSEMLAGAIDQFPLTGCDLLIVESVANLNVASAIDLGEDLRVMVCTFSEALELSRSKPDIWKEAGAVVLNKIDSITHPEPVLAELTRQIQNIQSVPVFAVSCASGQGVLDWTRWLGERVRAIRRHRTPVTTTLSAG